MRIAMLPGDGIGPEILAAADELLRVIAPEAELAYGAVGLGAWSETGSSLPAETLELVTSADATLLGAVTTPPGVPGYRSPVLELRQRLDLFANLRPARSIPHPASRPGIDLLLVRENTEGLYAGRESRSADGGTAVTERVITRRGSERVLRLAFERARETGRSKVTVVHKANVLRETCGLFLEVAREVAGDYPDLGMEDVLVDTCVMRLIRAPESFEVLCTTNLFGDILSDAAAELVGGLGVARSSNVGTEHAVFEPVHGSAPDLAGRGTANPLATFGAVVELLDHLGAPDRARDLERAMVRTVEQGLTTPDLGGTSDTDRVTEAVIASLDPR